MIKLQFVCGSGLASRSIAWFSSGHLSHVDALMPDGDLVGARSDGGVMARPQNYQKVISRVVFELNTRSPKVDEKFYSFITAQIGKSYDHLAILAFIFNRSWRDTEAWICSEMIAAGLEHAGVIPPLFLAANKISPVALALALSVLAPKITVVKTAT